MTFVLKDCMKIVLCIENDNLSNSDMLQVSIRLIFKFQQKNLNRLMIC